MRFHKHLIILLIAFFYLLNFPTAFAASNPTSMLQSIADNMIKGLKENKATLKSKPQIVYQLAYKYVVPYADITAMSKRVLPPAVWNSATPAEREQFKRAFTTTLIRTYASALTSYDDQSVHVFPVRGNLNASTIEVNSEIVGGGDPISVSYRLLRAGSSWRLYDISVEGVSMLESFRAQFEGILSQGNMKLLLNRMTQHNAR